jgi:hypothetical protein
VVWLGGNFRLRLDLQFWRLGAVFGDGAGALWIAQRRIPGMLVSEVLN